MKLSNNTLIIPDLHFPAQHPKTFSFLRDVIKEYKPNKCIQMGDIVDLHSISVHEKESELPSAKDELTQAVDCIDKLVDTVMLIPEVYVCLGNHDTRVFKMANRIGIPRDFIKSFSDIYGLPEDWKVGFEHIVDNVYYTHGKSAAPCVLSRAMGMSTVEGHFHSVADLTYYQTPNKRLWSMHCGTLSDDKHMSMSYGITNIRKSVNCCCMLIDGKYPTIIPME